MGIFLHISILFIFSIPSVIFSQWLHQDAPVQSNFKSVVFIDESTGWICANNVVLKTTDSGNSWSSTSIPGDFKSIFFINLSTGFLTGSNGKFFITTNSGTSWEDHSIAQSINLTSINFSSGTGIITGSSSTILKTTDNGNTWLPVNTGFNYDFYSSYILDQNTYLIAGSVGSIIKTTDGGSTWTDLSFGMINPFFTVQFVNYNTGWLIGCCGMYFKTTDAGLNWSPEEYLTEGYSIHSSRFINSNTGWAAADAGLIYRTTDGGSSWFSLVTNTTDDLYSIFMLNENTGWAVGNFGTILKTTNGGGQGTPIGVAVISENIPGDYILHQNYPNPFNPSTVISYRLPAAGDVKLTLIDVTGRELATLVNERQSAGTYNFQLSNDNLQLNSGVYFYRLTTAGFSQTRKLILLK